MTPESPPGANTRPTGRAADATPAVPARVFPASAQDKRVRTAGALLASGALLAAFAMPPDSARRTAGVPAPLPAPASGDDRPIPFPLPAVFVAADRVPGTTTAERFRDAERSPSADVRTWPPLIAAQASPGPSSALPSLVLPPAAGAGPPLFASLMSMGDTAMVRGDVLRARALYERAAAIHPASSAAAIAAGKTYDPNALSLLGVNGVGLADANKAREWYERARSLGDPAAAWLLASLR